MLSLILFTNGHQTLEVDRFVNNIKPGEAYKKFQAEVNKAPKQIKEQLIPNQNEKKDEWDLNKHSNALKEIDEKVKNYQSNQGSSIIQPLTSKQLLPNDQQIVQDNLKVINSLNHPIDLNPLNRPIDLNPLNQPIGLNSQSKPSILGQQSDPIFEDLKHQLTDTLVKNKLPAVANQEIDKIFDQLPQVDLHSLYENPQFRQIAMNVFNHLQNQDQSMVHPINQQHGQYNSLFNQQPNHESLFNNIPFNHRPIMSSRDVLSIMQRLFSFLPQPIDQRSIIGLANHVMQPNKHIGPEFPSIGRNFMDFMNTAPILPHKENVIYMLLNNLGMSKENTIVVPVQL